MKTFILILAITVSFISCERDNNPTGGQHPVDYDLYLELLRNDGAVHENGEVEINGGILKMVNGQLEGTKEFIEMGKLDLGSEIENTFFGIACLVSNCDGIDYVPVPLGSSAEGAGVNGSVSFEKDKYWLLRYANEDVDTLRVHDVLTTNPYNRTFTFFINEQKIEPTNFNIYSDSYAITIKK